MDNSLAAYLPSLNTENATSLESLAEQLIIQSFLSHPDCLKDYELSVDAFKEPFFKTVFTMLSETHKANAPFEKQYFEVKYKPDFEDESFSVCFSELWIYRDLKPNPNLKFYVDVLKKRLMKDSFERLKWQTSKTGKPVEEEVQTLIEGAKDLLDKYIEPAASSFNAVVSKVIEKAELAADGITPFCIKSHYPLLDVALGECVLEDYLVILGGQSGTGKTTFALNWARNVAKFQRHSCLYISLEMHEERIMRWYLSSGTRIEMNKFTTGKLFDDEYRAITNFLKELPPQPLEVRYTHPDIAVIAKTIRAHVKASPNCKMVIVDHLHFIRYSKSTNPVETLTVATATLKHLAMDLHVPIIALSQLIKPTNEAPNTAPHLGLLKGSGSIISDADLIMILKHNPHKNLGINVRTIDNYILKNRGGSADATVIPFAHYADKCLIIGG